MMSLSLPIAIESFGCGGCPTTGCPTHLASTGTGGADPSLLPAPDKVLSTLDKDGRRRWLRPRLSRGDWWRRRRILAYILMVVFIAIPHIRVGGKPLILLDIVAREFTVFGHTFYPTDTLVLALFMLSVFVSIVLITALAGRAWCGWACPQTVYMEYLFRPIDRLFEGTRGKGGKPRIEQTSLRQVARWLTYLVLCMLLAHTFLSYFVGTEKLAQWIRRSPLEHPTSFLVMAATTGLMLFDFLFFREQLCTIACPYGRFQSVMLDRQSLIVAYDNVRGEPRRKGKRYGDDDAGDCVDCGQCVVVCPTGIDIRDGLQMECVNCTQCIDACDRVMDGVKKPRGLIRFSSQDAIDGKPRTLIRARTIVYPLILLGVLSGLAFAVAGKSGFDARFIGGRGNPYSSVENGQIANTFSLRLVNRTAERQQYSFEIVDPEGIVLSVPTDDQVTLDPGDTTRVPMNVTFSARLTRGDGNEPAKLRVTDSDQNERTVDFRILGPR